MLSLIGNILILGAIALSVVFGVSESQFILSILICGAIFTAGYTLVRLPRLLGMFQTEGVKAIGGIAFLFICYSILSAIGYGIGKIFS